MKAVLGCKCPYCKSTQNFRHHRHPWMRRVPGSRFYECQYCNGKYLSVYKIFSYGVVKGKRIDPSLFKRRKAKS